MKRLMAAAALVLSACSAAPTPDVPPGAAAVEIAGERIVVELAVTPEQRRTGLMGRTDLAPDAGMLFVFPAPTDAPFWMKDTLIALDIAFLAPSGDRWEVVDVLTMQPCRADPCRHYAPSGRYVAALEVAAGVLAGLDAGARVTIEGELPAPT